MSSSQYSCASNAFGDTYCLDKKPPSLCSSGLLPNEVTSQCSMNGTRWVSVINGCSSKDAMSACKSVGTPIQSTMTTLTQTIPSSQLQPFMEAGGK